MYVLLYMT